ncbi:hypothetical protein FS837_007454 [Tulasnella sp. UAMH 9824]|nr:hypothetical protein FS837_007454 [Tulasnella sp. UAMH 9824]
MNPNTATTTTGKAKAAAESEVALVALLVPDFVLEAEEDPAEAEAKAEEPAEDEDACTEGDPGGAYVAAAFDVIGGLSDQ